MIGPASIPSPSSNGVHIGPFFFHAYGLAYVFAVAAAILITRFRWRRCGGNPSLVDEVALYGFPAGLIGGRIYFLITSWDQVPGHWWGPFAVWQGGLGIWGGIACGTAAGIWVLRRRHADVPLFMDATAPALLVAQSIGRIGNYFNQELFGGPTRLPWGLEISPSHRPAGYLQYATFHPTFLYEIVWNLLLAGFLVWLGGRVRADGRRLVRPPGLFALYVAGYSGFRIFEESLRVDPAHHIFGLRLNLYVAVILCLAGAWWFVAIQRGGGWPGRKAGARRRAGRGGAATLGVAVLVFGATGCGFSSRASAAAAGMRASGLPAATSEAGLRVSAYAASRAQPTGAYWRPAPPSATPAARSPLHTAPPRSRSPGGRRS
jgi:prolipoprotein diacylglyceryl transferase